MVERSAVPGLGRFREAGFALWGIMLCWLALTEAYRTFLHPQGKWLLLVAACLFFGFALSHGQHPPRPMSRTEWLKLGVLLLPVGFVLYAQGKTLSGYAFRHYSVAGRQPSSEQPLNSRGVGAQTVPITPSKSQFITLLDVFRRPKDLHGKTVTVEGMVHGKNKEGSTGSSAVILFRFAIVCCVADAMPVSMPVKPTGIFTLPDDSWVRATGELHWPDPEYPQTQGPTLFNAHLEAIPAPAAAYLY